MKITHFCLAGTITDGWSYQENLLAKYHQRQGHQVSILTSRWVYNNKHELYRCEKNDYLLADGIHVMRLDMKQGVKPNGRFARFIGVEESLEKLSPDILFIHGCQFLDMKKVVRYLRKHDNVVVYLDNHADFSNSATNFISKVLNKILWRHQAQLINPYVNKFYGVLPARCDFLKEIYNAPSNKVELLVMGADDELVEKASLAKNETRQRYHINEQDFLIVTGGKIDRFKTQTLLLMQAVHDINNAKVKLIVFGPVDNNLKDEVMRLSDGQIVQYLGWLNPEESYNLFGISNLVVFPGRHSVYWEQVAGMGIPMIVKDWEGTHHIDKGGNVLYLREDLVQEIKDKIFELLHNNDKYQKMMQAADKCKTFFSYNEIARRSIE